ncbi:uncharacterized protein LOC109844844 isoform X2 [Asparagus officinalis]|uniref:uncharacterized protein LOC109844844 isoform X1 n=1 Tax=Asparagus officinalis TaxID=4686 RepID=UPI00098E792F|nr:uncharacterized protein LOC109844844 isoform X1 [Asparagus officinalis]XP_020269585.1 uncharacterized protein LOC109844844 isoform X2 [Asparagus officinalis]
MLSLKPNQFHPLPLLNSPAATRPSSFLHQGGLSVGGRRGLVLTVKCAGEEEKKGQRSFLSPEEAGLVEVSGLSTHERFLCRLTISSLNLLRVISEQEGIPIEELNAGRICDWFLKDKLKREQDFESAVLQWDDSNFQI